MSPINVARVAKLLPISLSSGNHKSLKSGACVMEAVAYVADEKWSDKPKCACPVIAAFMRSWNDTLPTDADRDRLLKPLVERLVDTKATPEIEARRSYMALDWLVRVNTPKFLDLVPSLAEHAKALRDLEEIADLAGVTAAVVKTNAARAAAWDAAATAAAGAAAWDDAAGVAAAWDAAARAAAWAAARDAAWAAAAWDAAAGVAAMAAGDAARAAAVAADVGAWAAARDAAWAAAAWDAAAGDAAAGDAARLRLAPTVEWLQASALELVDRMIGCAANSSVGQSDAD